MALTGVNKRSVEILYEYGDDDDGEDNGGDNGDDRN